MQYLNIIHRGILKKIEDMSVLKPYLKAQCCYHATPATLHL